MQNLGRKIFILIVLLGFFQEGFSQLPYCGFDHQLQLLDQKIPGYKSGFDDVFNTVLSEKKHTHPLFKTSYSVFDTTYYIPVVFHVVYNSNAENLDSIHLQEQLEVLNSHFSRTHPDSGNTSATFKPLADNVQIQFKWATEDPEGNPTNGITRTFTDVIQFGGNNLNDFDEIKDSAFGGINAWDSDKYLNIWIGNIGESLLGYAYPPVNAPDWPSQFYGSKSVQGIVLNYKIVGTSNPNATGILTNYNEGKTGIHEAGHYLGLRHIWGDPNPGQQGCLVDDGIKDTPLAINPSNSCNLAANSCLDPGIDFPDNVENFMDYSGDACQNMFTKEQVLRMRSNLRKFRPQLASKKFILDSVALEISKGSIWAYQESGKNWIGIRPSKKGFYNFEILDFSGRVLHKETLWINLIYRNTWPTKLPSSGPFIIRAYNAFESMDTKVIFSN